MEDVLTQYEKGLRYLVEHLGEGHPRRTDAVAIQARFLEHIAAVRRWGETEALRAERARLVASLNQLTVETLGASFNEVRSYAQATEIKEQIEKLESLRSVLGDDTTDQKKSELEYLLRSFLESAGGTLVAGNLETSGGDFVGGNKSAGQFTDRSVIVGGDARGLTVITGDGSARILRSEQVDIEWLLAAYYRSVATECGRLPLGVIDRTFALSNDASPVVLSDVYVNANVTVLSPTRAHDVGLDRSYHSEGKEPKRIPLLHALANPQLNRVVVLGDPGAGKTTFINHLSYLLATNSLELPESVRGKLLVRLSLRTVAAGHISPEARRGTASVLWSALAEDISARLGTEAERTLLPHLQRRLLQEGGVILLDGLDEVPEAYQRRRVLVEAMRDLSDALTGTQSYILVTSRPYAFIDARWRLSGFAVLALAPFGDDEKGRFIEHWYEVMRISMGWDSETSRSKSEQLQRAVHERTYLAELASRPLLLTLMATLHSSWGQLPENRADLYEEVVRLLLGRWERAREVRTPDGEIVIEPGIAQVLGVGEEGVRAALEALAFGAHEGQSCSTQRNLGSAHIPESDMLVAFKPLLGALHPDVILQYLTDRAGLLVELGEGVFAFPHLVFQEYLAACYLLSRPDCGEALSLRVRTDPVWWQEVFLLAVARARTGSLGAALSLLNFMLPESPHGTQTNLELDWRIVSLVCRAMLDVLPFPAADAGHLSDASDRLYGALTSRLREWLRYLIQPSVALPEPEQLEALEAAERLFPEAMPEKPLVLAKLADARYARYLTRGSLADLETAILFYKQVRALVPADDPRQSQWADSLAGAMQIMYDHSAELDYLRASIEQYQFSVSAVTSDATYRVRVRRNMANVHLRLYQATRQLDCLQAAITAYREAIAETPPGMESALALQAELAPLLSLFNQQAFFSLWDDFAVEDRALRIRQFCEEVSRATHVPLVSFDVLPEGKGFLGVLDLSEMLRGVPVPTLSVFPILFLESCSGGDDLAYIRGVLADHLGPNCRRALLVPFRCVSALADLLDGPMRQVHAYDLISVSQSDLEHVLIDGQPGESLRRMIVSRVDLAIVVPIKFRGTVRLPFRAIRSNGPSSPRWHRAGWPTAAWSYRPSA